MKLWGLLVLAAAPLAGQSSLGEAADQARRAWLAHDAAALVAHSPSLVLQTPGADPSSPLGRAQAAELLRREAPHAKVLILTVHKNPEYIRKIIHCGARGYVLKDASGEELAHAIELVAAGRSYFSPEVSGEAIDSFFKEAKHPALSERELEVLKLVARGCSTKEIAPQLNITCRTVETYRERIMTKLGVHNVAGLTRFAISEGLIDLESP